MVPFLHDSLRHYVIWLKSWFHRVNGVRCCRSWFCKAPLPSYRLSLAWLLLMYNVGMNNCALCDIAIFEAYNLASAKRAHRLMSLITSYIDAGRSAWVWAFGLVKNNAFTQIRSPLLRRTFIALWAVNPAHSVKEPIVPPTDFKSASRESTNCSVSENLGEESCVW